MSGTDLDPLHAYWLRLFAHPVDEPDWMLDRIQPFFAADLPWLTIVEMYANIL